MNRREVLTKLGLVGVIPFVPKAVQKLEPKISRGGELIGERQFFYRGYQVAWSGWLNYGVSLVWYGHWYAVHSDRTLPPIYMAIPGMRGGSTPTLLHLIDYSIPQSIEFDYHEFMTSTKFREEKVSEGRQGICTLIDLYFKLAWVPEVNWNHQYSRFDQNGNDGVIETLRRRMSPR